MLLPITSHGLSRAFVSGGLWKRKSATDVFSQWALIGKGRGDGTRPCSFCQSDARTGFTKGERMVFHCDGFGLRQWVGRYVCYTDLGASHC